MIHTIFNRPSQLIKVYEETGVMFATYRGEGDAWGWTQAQPYGTGGWCPVGHFKLGAPQRFEPIASEGAGQIPVYDLTQDDIDALVKAGKAEVSGAVLTVGGLSLATGQLAYYNRSAIMLHGGGSNAPNPYAPYQMLCKTEGCTRQYNAEWAMLAGFLAPKVDGNIIVYSIVGDPVKLAC